MALGSGLAVVQLIGYPPVGNDQRPKATKVVHVRKVQLFEYCDLLRREPAQVRAEFNVVRDRPIAYRTYATARA
jgi:hypothetical protein